MNADLRLVMPLGLMWRLLSMEGTGGGRRCSSRHECRPNAASRRHRAPPRAAADADALTDAGAGRNEGRRRRPRSPGVAADASVERASRREGRRSRRYLSRRDSRRSARGLPPVWQVGQYWRAESAKETSLTTSPQTGQFWPARPWTARPAFFSALSSEAASPAERSIADWSVVMITLYRSAISSSVRLDASLNGDIFAACRTSSEYALPMPAIIFWSRRTPLIWVLRPLSKPARTSTVKSGPSG